MRILLVSTIPIETEGRALRTVNALSQKNDITIISPDSNSQLVNTQTINISKEIPRGLLSQINFFFRLVRRFANIKHLKFDAIYVCNYTSIPFGLYLWRKTKKIPIIYDAYELLVKTKDQSNTIRDTFYQYFEQKILNICAATICANKERALIMQGHYRLNQIPYVVPNMPTDIDLNEIDMCLNKKETNLDEKVVITYAGYISRTRRIDDLVTEVANLGDKYQLHIYGQGDYLDELAENVKRNSYENIHIFGRYSQEQLKNILAKTDIGYLYYPNTGLNNIYCEPNKVYDYAMNCVPMISYNHPTLKARINSNNIGISDDNLGNSIIAISDNMVEFRKNCRDFMIRSIEESKLIIIDEIIRKAVYRT